MTDLKKLLAHGDPLRDEGDLSAADAHRMRRIVVSAALAAAPARTPWLRPLALAAAGALLVVVGTVTGHRPEAPPLAAPAADPISTIGGSSGDDRRQLQFSTPGGTRIIWIFDQNLRLQESMP
jgi:hypothetical protein